MAVKHLCPDCDTLRHIECTKERQREGWSAMWWVIEHHKHPEKAEICPGSGKKV